MDITGIRGRDRLRIMNLEGNISVSMDNLIFSPALQTVDVSNVGFIPRTPSLKLSVSTDPVRLKAVITGGNLPTGALLFYKKNNGTPIGLGVNTYSSATFQDGDLLTLGVYLLSSGNTGICSFVLYNDKDEKQCSNTLTLAVTNSGVIGN